MNPKLRQYPGPRSLLAALAITSLAAIGSPGTAAASTTADAKLLNVVEVEYKDTSGTTTFKAAASTTVTVLLKKSALNYSLAPNGPGVGGPVCPPAVDTVSGGTFSGLIALAATANGDDTYTQSLFTNTPSNATVSSISYSTLDYQGLSPTAGPLNRVFGSAIPTAVKDATTLYFPGGALAGFQDNDIVVVSYGANKQVYLVDGAGLVVGTAATHPNSAAQTYTAGDRTQTVPEVSGELKLKAYDTQSITLNGANVNFGGGNIAPAFLVTPPTLQVPLGEMVLVKFDVTAKATSNTTDGTVVYDLTVTDGTNLTSISCTAGPFKKTDLNIKKEVRRWNSTTLAWVGTYSNTASGNPGDILEYKVTVSNTGGQAAKVKVTDAVPAYTTLVTHNATYDDKAGGTIFARISDNAATPNTVTLTMAVDAEASAQLLAPYGTGYGDAAGTTATSSLTFYVGDTSTNAQGGTVPSCSTATVFTSAACATAVGTWLDTYTIFYQVKID